MTWDHLAKRSFPLTTSKEMPAYLLSRGLDPILGISTGFLAYYLHENHSRTEMRDEDKLRELLRWKYQKYQEERRKALLALDTGV